ncbi:hypothetical protein ACP70R_037566 [Stipagrostis hirtigluma subsp. patula]
MVPYGGNIEELAQVMQGYKLAADGTMYYEGGATCCYESKAAGMNYIDNLINYPGEPRWK